MTTCVSVDRESTHCYGWVRVYDGWRVVMGVCHDSRHPEVEALISPSCLECPQPRMRVHRCLAHPDGCLICDSPQAEETLVRCNEYSWY